MYGKLTVIGERKFGYVPVQCDCGVVKEILFSNLTSGRTKSCGCGYRAKYNIDVNRAIGNNKVHGLSKSKLYRNWFANKYRNMLSGDWLDKGEFLKWCGDNDVVSFTQIERKDKKQPYSESNVFNINKKGK